MYTRSVSSLVETRTEYGCCLKKGNKIFLKVFHEWLPFLKIFYESSENFMLLAHKLAILV